MKFLKYTPGPVFYWVNGALTEFINGCIAGVGAGSLTGVGTGAYNTATSASASVQTTLLLSAVSAAGAILGNGIKRVVTWHSSGNPFPGFFAKKEDVSP